MKTVTVHLTNGDTRTHSLPHGGWEVDNTGNLHVQDANFRKCASYSAGTWAEVK